MNARIFWEKFRYAKGRYAVDKNATRYSILELWEHRRLFLKHANELDARGKKQLEHDIYIDEMIKGVSPLESIYFIDSKEPLNPLLKNMQVPSFQNINGSAGYALILCLRMPKILARVGKDVYFPASMLLA
ncbi:hypothetical protein G7Y89_g2011 [Cudoniella acicularis]|uniref:Uncharacterized protein n=1 Tax=Cudoniella acicularis TaxID=354080 RepID=A0A8H4W6W3_9HELO|nr:hypothetical protein G7Y89_g2011 [Cudoniella acicularis]